jgi:hypothetical protein
MNAEVFDLEADGLHPTKIHCLSVWRGKPQSTANYDNMRSFLGKAKVLVGHNIYRYDVPVLERLLNVKVEAKIIDTLALSWYLEPYRLRHGLADYGEEFGVKKPEIEDWNNLSVEEYMHRCNEDVRINHILWERQWKQLLNLYGTEDNALRFIDYLMFKMKCAADQERYGWKLDVDKVRETMDRLSGERDKKLEELTAAMPLVPVQAVRKPPAKPYKKNGQLSEAGIAWRALLASEGLPESHSEDVTYIKEYKQPNPGSSDQVKAWLFGLGWKPITFSYVKEQTGDMRKIPQVQQDKTKGPGLCESVKALFDKEPRLEILEGLSILSHRLSILKGFLDNVDNNGYVQAQIQGLTNTLRFKHKVIVNLPGVDKPYGSDIRGCLVAPEGFELAGSDMNSLEDNTARHYMYEYDPDYVNEMSKENYDPHLDLARFAGRISDSEYDTGRDRKDIKSIRRNYKTANYACKYGAGGAKLALTLGITKGEGNALVEAYWGRNWSVREVADNTEVKVCNGSIWLYNPVSRFWYSLRHDKDRFSTLNQSTGVFCFDTYLKYVVDNGPPIIGQMHDEWIALVKIGNRERLKAHVNKAIRKVNEELGLNVELKVGLDFGKSYADIH